MFFLYAPWHESPLYVTLIFHNLKQLSTTIGSLSSVTTMYSNTKKSKVTVNKQYQVLYYSFYMIHVCILIKFMENPLKSSLNV